MRFHCTVNNILKSFDSGFQKLISSFWMYPKHLIKSHITIYVTQLSYYDIKGEFTSMATKLLISRHQQVNLDG